MTESYSWSKVREDACERFRDSPRPETEADVLEAFKLRPRSVIQAVDEIAASVAGGSVTIRSPWALLRSKVASITRAPTVDIVVDDSSDREKAISLSERWIRTAGLHLDREDELMDELFERGRLRDHDTPALRRQMIALWIEQRPRGERAEAEHEAYLARYAEQRAQIRAARGKIKEQAAEQAKAATVWQQSIAEEQAERGEGG